MFQLLWLQNQPMCSVLMIFVWCIISLALLWHDRGLSISKTAPFPSHSLILLVFFFNFFSFQITYSIISVHWFHVVQVPCVTCLLYCYVLFLVYLATFLLLAGSSIWSFFLNFSKSIHYFVNWILLYFWCFFKKYQLYLQKKLMLAYLPLHPLQIMFVKRCGRI